MEDFFWLTAAIIYVAHGIIGDKLDERDSQQLLKSDLNVQWALEDALLTGDTNLIDATWQSELGHRFFPRQDLNNIADVYKEHPNPIGQNLYFRDEVKYDMLLAGKKYSMEKTRLK